MLDLAPTTSLRFFSGDAPPEACVGSLTIPTRDHINAATATSLIHTDWSFLPIDRYIERSIVQGNLLTLQRNEAIQHLKGDWLFFIDDDMVWDSKAIGQLIAARDEIDADIIGGLCFLRAAPHEPTLFMREHKDRGGYNFLEKWDRDIVEVDATGMAFVIIHKRVFEMIAGSPMPTLETREKAGPPQFFRWEGVLGEDLRFCQDAKAAGARIFVDTRIEIGHISEIEIRKRHFLMEALNRPAELTAARQAINDKMGLPTLVRDDIKEELGLD